MPFDRTKPVNGTKFDADFLRGQFNDLDDREKVLATQIAAIKLDFAGLADGMGNPTVQDGAIFRFDAMTNRVKPWNVTVQTIYYTDNNGNPASMQVLVPPP